MKRRHDQANKATNGPITEQDTGDVPVPYESLDFDMSWSDHRVGIVYNRIPKGDCKIRRRSEVIGANKQTLGHVEGFVSDGKDLVAIAVRTGVPGFSKTILVPFGSVETVSDRRVRLSIDKAQFEFLPEAPKFRLGRSQLRKGLGPE